QPWRCCEWWLSGGRWRSHRSSKLPHGLGLGLTVEKSLNERWREARNHHALRDLDIGLAAQFVCLELFFLPDPNFPHSEATIDIQLVESTVSPDHLDGQIGRLLRGPDGITFIRLESTQLCRIAHGEGSIAFENETFLDCVDLEKTSDQFFKH